MSLLKKTKTCGFFCAMVYILVSYQVSANDYSTKELEELAQNFVASQTITKADVKTKFSTLPLDTRIPSKFCVQDLQLSTAAKPPFNRQVTVQIRCTRAPTWTQYVHVRINEMYPIIVSTQLISKGELLTKGHLKIEYKPKQFVRAAYIEDLSLLIGSKSKRTLREGMPIGTHQVCMVCKGDMVTIFAKTRTLTIKTSGVALQDGNLGEQIRVKNQKSGKTVSARVKDVESVEVNI
ncbi:MULTISPECIES: flagellar basal body P-ring formation chaperone FlgA [Pseudoalteromonas]|uniref:Flagella basal body P-ring formation protein FlgA n=1 Tax=Pseudoalteromonas aurantia 208 TaxID=1314867 RepID=A0ABR9E9D0_9GAMM|nr:MULTISPECIES: flagellar basal body P-ring formation chaperone FlgA [Pseudoalteromonas]MBE0367367.1 flagella basal body P-ring formation protein FlgA [Pseudoalteromonas aurantia 208]MBQ4846295.1 flagellar basal body P-ring formation protein FlgA [Pseudoalteromonas sp. MMG005]